MAFDRILATAMGVKAFELIEQGAFGQMVTYRNNLFESVPLTEAVASNKNVTQDHALVNVARQIGISFGD
ncbi:MAG: hypothetical protein R2795_15600 [Saprospiraceae bacterium]